MFVKPENPSDCKLVSLHGKSIEVIRLPKYMHQDNTDKYSVAIVLVHDISKPLYSYKVSPYGNSLLAYGSKDDTPEEKDRVKEDFRNSFTILLEREFGTDEIKSLDEPFIPILDKLWDAIKNGDKYFDFNEHADTEQL